jgi:sugar-specific transcriptional regulator TrmB/predicted hydrocarbon binding protein
VQDWLIQMSIGDELVLRFVESGLGEKEARVIVALSSASPTKASEIGRIVGISRMDAYNTLKRLQEQGIISATVEKPMRFTAIPINDVFELLIHREEQELQRLKENLAQFEAGNFSSNPIVTDLGANNPETFTVVKDRHNIYAAIERLISDSEEEIWLTLGKWGIMHFVKTGALDALAEAVARGVRVHMLVTLDHLTLKFYDKLDAAVEVRHSEQLSMHGCIVDDDVAVQAVRVDSNPVGRGREDSALIIEAPSFIAAQKDLVQACWASAVSADAARVRLVEHQIIEPLTVELGDGSFYQRLKELIADQVSDQHPTSVGWTNAILRRAGEPIPTQLDLPTFEALGIDISELLRQVGRRIGEEIAIGLGQFDDDEQFWEELSSEWRSLGMGELLIEGSPISSIRISDSGACGGAPNFGRPFCHLDEGIIEGIIRSRFGLLAKAVERECTAQGEDHCYFEISFVELAV